MKRILIILLLCVGSFIHAQEYQLSEIEDIAYTFFNRGPRYIQGGDHTHPTKQIAAPATTHRVVGHSYPKHIATYITPL